MRRLKFARAVLAAVFAAALPLTPVLSATTLAPTAGPQVLSRLQTKGKAEIDRRIKNLQQALDKLSKSNTINAADKATLTGQVNDEVSSLTALEAKLNADTTAAAARTDVQSIVSDYRVYVLMLPKVRMVASDDRFSVVAEKLTSLHDKLQARVNSLNLSSATAGQVSTKLTDMKAKLDDAKAKFGGLSEQLLVLRPSDYNSNHAVLETFRAAMATAQSDLKAARDDAKSVIDDLGPGSAGAHSTASPAPQAN
jgi:chromosome segregation ATPase